jgi:hypothetical protein
VRYKNLDFYNFKRGSTPFTVHLVPLISQPTTDATAAIKRTLQMTAINQRHDLKICIRDRIGHVIKRRSRQVEKFALATHRKIRMITINHFFPLAPWILTSPRSKKSFSIVSLPSSRAAVRWSRLLPLIFGHLYRSLCVGYA